MLNFYGNVDSNEFNSAKEFINFLIGKGAYTDMNGNTNKNNIHDDKLRVNDRDNVNNQTFEDIKQKNLNGGFNLWETYFLLKNNDNMSAKIIDNDKCIYFVDGGKLICKYKDDDLRGDEWLEYKDVHITERILNTKFKIILPNQENWIDCTVEEAVNKQQDNHDIRYIFDDNISIHYIKGNGLMPLGDLHNAILNNARWQYLKEA